MFESHLNLGFNPLRDYLITQFEPEKIVMQHSKTKAKYFYREVKVSDSDNSFLQHLNQRVDIQHDNLIKINYHVWKEATVGLLFEYYTNNLQTEIARRTRITRTSRGSSNNRFFTEEQLVNTFAPVMSCLSTLHQQNLAHGHLRAQNIIVNQNFETKLCDAMLVNQDTLNRDSILQNAYYPPEFLYTSNLSVEGDLWALGMLILETTILDTLEQFYDRGNNNISVNGIQKKIDDIDHSFTDEFIVAIKLLLSSDKALRKEGVKVMQDGMIPEGYFNQLRPKRTNNIERFYDSESPKKRNLGENRNSMTMTAAQFQLAIHESKKEILKESDNQGDDKKSKIEVMKEKYKNKHGEEVEIKKKQIEKINKIIERSNAFVNQLMSKRMEKPSGNSKILSLGKTTLNLSLGSSYKREFCNENNKKLERTPVREKEDKDRLTLATNGTLLSAEIEAIRERSRDSPKKLYLKRQPEKLKSLSKKK